MAQTGTPSSTTSGLQTTEGKYFDSILISTLDPQTRFLQFAQMRPLPQGRGNVAVWNRATRLNKGYLLSEGNPISAVQQISTTNVSGTIQQYGDAVNVSDLLQLTTPVDARKIATERLAQAAAETIDYVILSSILDKVGGSNSGATVTHYIKGSTSGYFANSTDVTATASDPRLQVSDIRQVVTKLKSLNVPFYDGQNFVGVIHPNITHDVQGDSAWTNAHIYTTPENIYQGEIGRLYSVRFVESTLAPVSAGSANGIAISVAGVSQLAYGTVIFGREFFGATEIDGGVKTYMHDGASKADPLNQTTIVGYKINFASRVLNPSAGIVAWAASGDTMTGASSTSARKSAGITIDDYPTSW